jgi:hypothetical protein
MKLPDRILYSLPMAIVTFFALTLPVSCTKDQGKAPVVGSVASNPCDSVHFAKNIKPIIDTKCAISGCHASGTSLGSNYDWTVFDNLKARAVSGTLKTRVIDQGTMPPGGKLPQEELDKIACWIGNGSPND